LGLVSGTGEIIINFREKRGEKEGKQGISEKKRGARQHRDNTVADARSAHIALNSAHRIAPGAHLIAARIAASSGGCASHA
jgi:hypothetical protein